MRDFGWVDRGFGCGLGGGEACVLGDRSAMRALWVELRSGEGAEGSAGSSGGHCRGGGSVTGCKGEGNVRARSMEVDLCASLGWCMNVSRADRGIKPCCLLEPQFGALF